MLWTQSPCYQALSLTPDLTVELTMEWLLIRGPWQLADTQHHSNLNSTTVRLCDKRKPYANLQVYGVPARQCSHCIQKLRWLYLLL